MTRVLVVGGDGLIGSALTAGLTKNGFDVIATTRNRSLASPARPYVDLAEPSTWPHLSADVVFLCAAVTSIAQCEKEPEYSRRVNVDVVLELARRVEGTPFFCLLSTTAVFPGDRAGYAPSDTVAPQNEYGKQKAEAERLLRESVGKRACIIRLGKVTAPGDGRFQAWAAALQAGIAVDAFGDARIAPVSIHDVAALLDAVAGAPLAGTFHFTSSDELTYADAARVIAAAVGANPSLINAVPSLGRAATHAQLDSRDTAMAYHVKIPQAATAFDGMSVLDQ